MMPSLSSKRRKRLRYRHNKVLTKHRIISDNQTYKDNHKIKVVQHLDYLFQPKTPNVPKCTLHMMISLYPELQPIWTHTLMDYLLPPKRTERLPWVRETRHNITGRFTIRLRIDIDYNPEYYGWYTMLKFTTHTHLKKHFYNPIYSFYILYDI
jgi:hypothetical protein